MCTCTPGHNPILSYISITIFTLTVLITYFNHSRHLHHFCITHYWILSFILWWCRRTAKILKKDTVAQVVNWINIFIYSEMLVKDNFKRLLILKVLFKNGCYGKQLHPFEVRFESIYANSCCSFGKQRFDFISCEFLFHPV